jgi:hypothetical protein
VSDESVTFDSDGITLAGSFMDVASTVAGASWVTEHWGQA